MTLLCTNANFVSADMLVCRGSKMTDMVTKMAFVDDKLYMIAGNSMVAKQMILHRNKVMLDELNTCNNTVIVEIDNQGIGRRIFQDKGKLMCRLMENNLNAFGSGAVAFDAIVYGMQSKMMRQGIQRLDIDSEEFLIQTNAFASGFITSVSETLQTAPRLPNEDGTRTITLHNGTKTKMTVKSITAEEFKVRTFGPAKTRIPYDIVK